MVNNRGGSNYKKTKKGTKMEKVDNKVPLASENENCYYAVVIKKLGIGFSVYMDGKEIIASIRGKMRNRKWLYSGDFVLVNYDLGKYIIVHAYSHDDVKRLKSIGELKEFENMEKLENDFSFEHKKNNNNEDDDEFNEFIKKTDTDDKHNNHNNHNKHNNKDSSDDDNDDDRKNHKDPYTDQYTDPISDHISSESENEEDKIAMENYKNRLRENSIMKNSSKKTKNKQITMNRDKKYT